MSWFVYKLYGIYIAIIFSVAIICVFPCAAGADCPNCSTGSAHTFYGTVSNNGRLVGAGYVVTAMINGSQVASAVTDDQGRWGENGSFIVSASAGEMIEFYVNGVLAGSAAGCIAANELNLSVSGAPVPSGTATSVPATSGSSVTRQQSAASDVTGVIESSATTTFFIGQQPTSVKKEAAVTIICRLPGDELNITLHDGVVVSKTELSSANNEVVLELADNTSIDLNGSKNIIVERILSPVAVPPDCNIVEAYSFEPENTAFNPPVTLKLKYDLNSLPATMEAGNLYIAQLTDTGEWRALNSSIDISEKSVSAQLSHFSTYALMGRLTVDTPLLSTDSTYPGNINQSEAPDTVPAGKLSEGTESTVKEGNPTSIMDKIVLAVFAVGGILIVVLVVSIIRHRPYG